MLFSTPVAVTPLAMRAPPFDAAFALRTMNELARRYPDRVTGTPSSRRAAVFVRERFRQLGYRVTFQPFELVLRGTRVRGENVIASRGELGEARIALLAHYDGPTTSSQAAEDDASGVGTLLALAQTFRDRRDIAFVATDAEEWGMIGARASRTLFAHLRCAVAIDNVTVGPPAGLQFTYVGQGGGYTPLWLRIVGLDAAAAETENVVYPFGVREWIDRTVDISLQDQGPFVAAGIPALAIGSVPYDRTLARARYHTQLDVVDGFDPRTFAMVGRAVARIVLAVPSGATVRNETDAFFVSRVRAIPTNVFSFVQMLVVLPLVVAAALLPRDRRGTRPRDFMVFVRRIVPLLIALLALYALVALGVPPRYELYPATSKDPFLYAVQPSVVATLLPIVLLGYFVALRLEPYAFRRSSLCMLLVLDVLAACIVNRYGALLYLAPFAYGAFLLPEGQGVRPTAVRSVMLAAAALPFLLVLALFANEIELGPFIGWYVLLQAAYGVWPFDVLLIGMIALVIWCELLAWSWRSETDSAERALHRAA